MTWPMTRGRKFSGIRRELKSANDEKMGAGLSPLPVSEYVIKDSMEANAKSSLKLMTLGAKQGDKLIIRAEGEDETEAADALAAMISEG